MHPCLLACSQLTFSPLILIKNACPGNGAAHSGLGLPTSINNQGDPTDMLLGQPDPDIRTLFRGDSSCQVNS